MIVLKIVLVLALAVAPIVPIVLAMPVVSSVVVLALLGVWLAFPSWGSWLYVGCCLGLMQWRAWQLYVNRLRMSVYVFSPSMAIQNSRSVWLQIAGAIGGICSFAEGDVMVAVLGWLFAALLFGLQGILFPNPEVISHACGYPLMPIEELRKLLEKVDYPTLLRFNRQSRKAGISGPMLGVELTQFLEKRDSRQREVSNPSR